MLSRTIPLDVAPIGVVPTHASRGQAPVVFSNVPPEASMDPHVGTTTVGRSEAIHLAGLAMTFGRRASGAGTNGAAKCRTKAVC